MTQAKTLLQCVLFAILAALAVRAYIAIEQAQRSMETVTVQTTAAIGAVRGYAEDARAQLNDPQVRRGAGLLLRSGDDLARTIKKANVVLDNLNNAISDTNTNLNKRLLPAAQMAIDRTAESINGDLVPRVAGITDEAGTAIRTATDAIATSQTAFSEGLGTATASLTQIERRISDPKIDAILSNIESGTDHANKTLSNVEKKTDQLMRPASWFWRALKNSIVIIGRIFLP